MPVIIAEQYEPFLKRSVLGNILDQVDNNQYNLKLYMIPPLTGAANQQTTAPDGNDQRANTPDAAQASGGGYLNDAFTAPPNQTVVLAQTGVTGAQIDNLEITAAVGPGGSMEFTTVNFDIIQPGAADFMDQIIAAKAALGDEILSNDVPLFLEIVFKGYMNDTEVEDLGGQAALIAGPYRMRLAIKNVSLEIDEAGSVYAFTCVNIDNLAYTDDKFRMPKKLESIGTTITEHVENLVKKIEEHNRENNNDYQIQDEIEIDLSGLVGGETGLSDDSLTTSSDVRAEEINRIMNPELEGKTEEEYEDILKQSAKDEGGLDIVVEENRVTVRENVTIERYIATLLSMNDEFFARATRAVKAEDPENNEVKKDQAFINWFKVNAGVKYLSFDRKRNVYAKKVIYKPVMFKTAKNTVQAKSKENSGLTKQDIQTRLDQVPILKAYHYLFTGLNDQIYNCRIEYRAGVAILTAPAGGMAGDFSTVMAKTTSNSATPDDDLTNNDLLSAAVDAAKEENSSGAIDDLFKQSGAERENDIRGVGQLLGFSDAEIADALGNRNGQNAAAIKGALKNRASAQALQNAAIAANNQNANSGQLNIDGSDYTPTVSGYVYSADIIGAVSDRLEQASALNAAQQQAAAVQKADEKDAGQTKEAIQSRTIPNQAEDGTYNGTPRNTIFGYLMQQHGATDFLVNLSMEVKGDPWYLGPPSPDAANPERPGVDDVRVKSDESGIQYVGDENYILFDLQTPRRFDFNVDDEDENSGYWDKMGTAYFITGIYGLRRVTSIFQGGEFRQELDMYKQSVIDLKQVEPEAEGTEE